MEVEYSVADVVKRGNPVVFFDLDIAGDYAGRLEITVSLDIVP